MNLSRTPELFSVSLQAETKTTPPALLNRLKELAKESPRSSTSPDSDYKVASRMRSHKHYQAQQLLFKDKKQLKRSNSQLHLKQHRRDIANHITSKIVLLIYRNF